MSQVQYRNEKTETKRVYFAGSDVLPQGAALCYDADFGTATAADNERAFRVQQPTTANFQNFAGILSDQFAGVQGPAMVEIFVPVARGQKVTVRSGASNTIDATNLRLKDQSYELDTDGAGPVVARAMQTVDRSTTSGPVLALLLGSAGANPAEAAIASVVDALDGATLTGNTLTTSATPTVDELEACVGVLGGKVNAILAALRVAGIIKP